MAPGESAWSPYLYVLPALLVYGLFVLAPLGHSAWLSFFTWDGITDPSWNGLGNYRALVTDGEIRGAFLHSLALIVFYSLLPVSIGLLLAASLSRARVRGLTIFRTLLFLPQVIPMVVVAVAWRWIYAPQSGLLNEILRGVGLGNAARPWLGDFTWALPSIGFVGSWVQYGLAMVLFMAGVQKIPLSLYEAARIDGAGAIREFFAVTLPALRYEIAVATVLTMIAALRNFDLIYLTTQGGPGNATMVPAMEVYRRAFQTGAVGSSAAIGVALALVILSMTLLINRIAERTAR